jgi:hypothetical protein
MLALDALRICGGVRSTQGTQALQVNHGEPIELWDGNRGCHVAPSIEVPEITITFSAKIVRVELVASIRHIEGTWD